MVSSCLVKLFNIDLFHKNKEAIYKKLSYFVNLRYYIQYHIHSVKTYLHIRMNKKGKELEKKLDSSKIIPSEYLKDLETTNFYINLQKKEEEIKLFTQDYKKINI
jgi:hypothetical protein